MKNLYITFLALVSSAAFSQTTIFSENFGTPSGQTAISANTFQNGSPILFSGNADIRINTPSDYAGASGAGFVFLASTTSNRSITIEGINTLNFTDLVLSFGQHKSTNASSNQLTVEVSSDGTTWSPLTYTRPTGPGTSIWTPITTAGTIPATANLRVKFENPMSNAGYRIDDVKIVGTPVALNNDQNAISGLRIYPNPAKNNLFINSDSLAEKQVELYDVLGKVILQTKTNNTPINISGLTHGIYVIKITEGEKTATRKIMIE